MIKFFWTILFCIYLFITSSLDLAAAPHYILPSEFICTTWLQKHRGVKALLIESKVVASENDKSSTPAFSDITWVDLSHKKILSWAIDSSRRKLYFSEKPFSHIAPLGQLLLGATSTEMLPLLKRLDIPVVLEKDLPSDLPVIEKRALEKVYLRPWSPFIMWVLSEGFPSQEGTDPLLAFQQNTFYPFQFRYYDPAVGTLNEFRMENYEDRHHYPFPEKIRSYQGSEKTFVYTSYLEKLSTEVSSHPLGHSSHTGFTLEANKNISIELRKFIQLYYESSR